MTNELLVIYRACGNELLPQNFKNGRPIWFNKFKSWKSFFDSFGCKPNINIHVVWDGDENELLQYIEQNAALTIHKIQERSNQGSLRYVLNLAYSLKNNYKYCYLSEDDHVYVENSNIILLEGLRAFHPYFVTTGDHLHRYLPNNGDIITTDNNYITKNSYWRTSESYVFSFGFSMETLEKFYEKLHYYNDSGKGAVRDRDFFRMLISVGYRLFSPIPSYSTHAIITDLSPVRNWDKIVNQIDYIDAEKEIGAGI